MLSKEKLRERFSKEPEKFYKVELFKEKGFIRKVCSSCRRGFWTLDHTRKVCGDSSCENYNFIHTPPTKESYDFFSMWEEFSNFFKKKGHEEISRYPVVARWRDDVYFTNASIYPFQPWVTSGEVPPPANPLIINQPCLRFGGEFSDIDNVGITGRHLSCFFMSGQHAFNLPKKKVYWKDKCIDYNFEFLTRLGIEPEEITYAEDVWVGGGNFGPCLESIVRGLELANSVFMQYKFLNGGYKELPVKVIDVGWGFGRLVWISQGSHTVYDAIFGPVMKKVKTRTGLSIDKEIIDKYSELAGKLDVKDPKLMLRTFKIISNALGISPRELAKTLEPLQSAYALADHARGLAFALTDGALPSNTGAGHEVRTVIRRALSFINYYDWNLTLPEVVSMHINYLSQAYPELEESEENINKILEIEEERYNKTLERGREIIISEAKKAKREKKTIGTDLLLKLYESHGISPEMVKQIGKEKGLDVSIPSDFYSIISAKVPPIKEEESEKPKIKTDDLSDTNPLYYTDPYLSDFEANILRKSGNYVVLDKTAFYPEGGGQPADHGHINGAEVIDVQKIGNVVIHKVKGNLKKKRVKGEIDVTRRLALMQNHTATHIILGAAVRVLGDHVWQAGAQKGVKMSRIDITHYRGIRPEELEEIERLANWAVIENKPVEIEWLPRSEAEAKYGFRLYQGGAVPGKTIRVVRIPDWNVEACAGIHVLKTSEVGPIKIIKTERIQDGVDRIEFAAGIAAIEQMQKERKILRESVEDLGIPIEFLPKTVQKFFNEWKERGKEINRLVKELNILRSEALSRKIENIGPYKAIVAEIEKADMKDLLELFSRIKEKNLIAVFAGTDKGVRVLGFSDVKKVNILSILEKHISKIEGSIKGKATLAKGGGPKTENTKEFLRACKEEIKKILI